MINYTVSAILHFDDGVNKGNLTVKADSEEGAKKAAIDKLKAQWRIPESKIDIVKVRKG
jgi:hypothetical protein